MRIVGATVGGGGEGHSRSALKEPTKLTSSLAAFCDEPRPAARACGITRLTTEAKRLTNAHDCYRRCALSVANAQESRQPFSRPRCPAARLPKWAEPAHAASTQAPNWRVKFNEQFEAARLRNGAWHSKESDRQVSRAHRMPYWGGRLGTHYRQLSSFGCPRSNNE